jgi:hypothetical protein
MRRRRSAESDWTLSTRCIDSQGLIRWAKRVSPDAPAEPTKAALPPPAPATEPEAVGARGDASDEEEAPTLPSMPRLKTR